MPRPYYITQDSMRGSPFILLRYYSNKDSYDNKEIVVLNKFDIKFVFPHYKGTRVVTPKMEFITPYSLNKFKMILNFEELVDENYQEDPDQVP